MPFSQRSRYLRHQPYTATDAKGAEHTTIPMRQAVDLTRGDHFEHLLAVTESMESIASRYYSDSQLWWRVADANPLRFPLDTQPGDLVAVPSAIEVGRVVRTRRV